MRSPLQQQQNKSSDSPVQLRSVELHQLREQLPKFAWQNRWLRGEEYGALLDHMTQYCEKFGLAMLGANQHPLQIYQLPQNGMIYFTSVESLQAFGFPRIAQRKTYRWKKMNFTTHLPKRNPIVTYIVASSYLTEPVPLPNAPEFRMHAVVPYNRNGNFVLCHVRQVGVSNNIDAQSQNSLQSFSGEGGMDFYRLFLLLHNNYYHLATR